MSEFHNIFRLNDTKSSISAAEFVPNGQRVGTFSPVRIRGKPTTLPNPDVPPVPLSKLMMKTLNTTFPTTDCLLQFKTAVVNHLGTHGLGIPESASGDMEILASVAVANLVARLLLLSSC